MKSDLLSYALQKSQIYLANMYGQSIVVENNIWNIVFFYNTLFKQAALTTRVCQIAFANSL